MKKIKKPYLIIGIIIILGAGYYVYCRINSNKKPTTPAYTAYTVKEGSITTTLAESGQIAPANLTPLAIEPQTSGIVESISAKTGQHVNEGDLLATLNSQTAESALQSAQNSLSSAENSLAQLQSSPTALSLSQDQDALAQAQNALTTEQANDTVEIKQDQDAIAQAQNAYNEDQSVLTQARSENTQNIGLDYAQDYNSISNTFISLSNAANDLKNFTGATSDTTEWYRGYQLYLGENYAPLTAYMSDYTNAIATYQSALSEFQSTPSSASQTQILQLLNDTVASAQNITIALNDANNLINQMVNNVSPISNESYSYYSFASALESARTSIPSDITNLNGQENTLVGDQNNISAAEQNNSTAIQKDQDAVNEDSQKLAEANQTLNILQNQTIPTNIAQDQQAITEKQEALAQLQSGATALQIQSDEISIANAKLSAQNAELTLSYCSIKAPVSGIISTVSIQQGQNVSSGTTAFDLVADNNLAELTANEVDAAKIQVGNPVTLTFNALPNVNAAGKVASIDVTGAISQGVVTYNVYVSLDKQNDQIKPGMSVSAIITTASKTNILVVPSAAITSSTTVNLLNPTQTGASYVEIIDPTTKKITRQQVTIGISNNTDTEITSGLSAGETVVIKGSGNAFSTSNFTGSFSSGAATKARTSGFSGGRGNAGFGAIL